MAENEGVCFAKLLGERGTNCNDGDKENEMYEILSGKLRRKIPCKIKRIPRGWSEAKVTIIADELSGLLVKYFIWSSIVLSNLSTEEKRRQMEITKVSQIWKSINFTRIWLKIYFFSRWRDFCIRTKWTIVFLYVTRVMRHGCEFWMVVNSEYLV